jgi:hypothetical protein
MTTEGGFEVEVAYLITSGVVVEESVESDALD